MDLELVDCSPQYWEFVRNLRNDKRVNEGFVDTDYITKDMQEKYMEDHAAEYRIALLNNLPVGYVGVIADDIRICTEPNFQGRGIGKFMITEIMKIWPNSYAKIKISNRASIKLFESCGFSKKFVILTK